MPDKKWLAQLEDNEPHFFGTQKKLSPAAARREAKLVGEAIRKRMAEIKAEEATAKNKKKKQ